MIRRDFIGSIAACLFGANIPLVEEKAPADNCIVLESVECDAIGMVYDFDGAMLKIVRHRVFEAMKKKAEREMIGEK
jgi:uncharacterized YccA/Bax inhibitor family protein